MANNNTIPILIVTILLVLVGFILIFNFNLVSFDSFNGDSSSTGLRMVVDEEVDESRIATGNTNFDPIPLVTTYHDANNGDGRGDDSNDNDGDGDDANGNDGDNSNVDTAKDNEAPIVTVISPVSGTNFDASEIIEISAEITDDSEIDYVFAIITLPNGVSQAIGLSEETFNDNIYTGYFILPSILGDYEVIIFAVDEEGNIGTGQTDFTVDNINGPTDTECNNGEDDDNDHYYDAQDPGCWTDITDPTTFDPSLDDESRADFDSNSAPVISDLKPLYESVYEIYDTFEIFAKVVDDEAVELVWTYVVDPSGDVDALLLDNPSFLFRSHYSVDYDLGSETGEYFIYVLAIDNEDAFAIDSTKIIVTDGTFGGDNECNDLIDNDNDGKTDSDDPSCWTDSFDSSTYDPTLNDESRNNDITNNECSDGIDNDNDGTVDSADFSCWTDITDSSTYDPDLDDESKDNPPIACFSDSDCGTDGFVGETFCMAAGIGQEYLDYTCTNAGTTAAQCNVFSTNNLIEACLVGEACDDSDVQCHVVPQDKDGDGFDNTNPGDLNDDGKEIDCNDNDDSVYPGAYEICDGKDNDCDGEIDEETTGSLCPSGEFCSSVANTCVPLCTDTDGDGFDDCNIGDEGDDGEDLDCNDNDSEVYPGATEMCNGVDDNCDGVIDNNDHTAMCGSGLFCNNGQCGNSQCSDGFDNDNDNGFDALVTTPPSYGASSVNIGSGSNWRVIGSWVNSREGRTIVTPSIGGVRCNGSTLTRVCNLAGYQSYSSYACSDFDSCGDNTMSYWTGSSWVTTNACNANSLAWRVTCVNPYPQYAATHCNDGVDNDGDGLIDLNDPGCVDRTDNSELQHDLQCIDLNDNSE